MHFKLIYISPNGTTKITSKILKKAIEKDGHSLELLDLGQGANRENFQIILKAINKGDIVGFGSPVYHMDMLEPMKGFFETMKSTGEVYSFKAFLYLNYAGITSGKAFINIAKFKKIFFKFSFIFILNHGKLLIDRSDNVDRKEVN